MPVDLKSSASELSVSKPVAIVRRALTTLRLGEITSAAQLMRFDQTLLTSLSS